MKRLGTRSLSGVGPGQGQGAGLTSPRSAFQSVPAPQGQTPAREVASCPTHLGAAPALHRHVATMAAWPRPAPSARCTGPGICSRLGPSLGQRPPDTPGISGSLWVIAHLSTTRRAKPPSCSSERSILRPGRPSVTSPQGSSRCRVRVTVTEERPRAPTSASSGLACLFEVICRCGKNKKQA